MTISIHQKKTDNSCILEVSHKPSLILENVELVEKASTIKDLSLERLLGDTILVRSYHKLHKVWQILKKHSKNDSSYIKKDHSCLVIPITKSFRSCGNLYLAVDPQTGSYVCASTNISHDSLEELERAVNNSIMQLVSWLPKLRLILATEHCRATLQNLPASVVQRLPLSNTATHAVSKLGQNVIYLKLSRFDSFYIIIQVLDDGQDELMMSYKYHLLRAVKDNASHATGNKKADVMVEINAALFEELDHSDRVSGRFENSEMALIVAACNSRIPFIELTHDLIKEGLVYEGLSIDTNAGLCVKLLDLEPLQKGSILEKRSLAFNTLQCSFRFRLIEKASKPSDAVGFRIWYTEFVFANNPLKAESKQGQITRLSLRLDVQNAGSPAKGFKEVWMVINKLYGVAVAFADVLYSDESNLSQIVSVHSYDFQSLVLKYGSGKNFTIAVNWSYQNQAFVLNFGRVGTASYNSHSYASHYLTTMFNHDNDLGKLMQVLHDTIDPLRIACAISTFPVIGMVAQAHNAKHVCDNFSVIVQSPWRFLMVYRSIFALEVCCLTGRKVSLRDGGLSKCDSSVVKEGLQAITGLTNFLTTFCKQSLYFGPAGSRDDPVVVEQSSKMHGVDIHTVPHGNWAGGSPLIISHMDFVRLLREQRVNGRVTPSILEQFLGLSFLKNELARNTRTNEHYYFPQNVTTNPIPSEISSIQFAVNSLLGRCSLQFNGERLALTLKLQPVPPSILRERGLQLESFLVDNLHILERFFQVRVATYPYRPNNVFSYCNIIASKPQSLSDFVNIMRLELIDHQSDPNSHWIPQLCLTIPPRLAVAAPFAPAVYIKDKILIVLLLIPKKSNGTPISR